MKPYAVILAAAAAMVAASAAIAQDNAASGEIVNPFRGVMQDRSAHSEGEALYVEKCSMCHRRMGMGTVLLARRLPPEGAELEDSGRLTTPYITLAARQGIGNMPRISRAEVSDEQLAQIAAYLVEAGGQ
jgi:mono/diheme cytochrome c family protein